MVVHPSVPAKTLAEFIALAKKEPGKLAYASSGPGTPYHMAGELFKAMTGTDILHVPHKSSGEARNDVMGGHVQMMFDAVTTMKGSIDAGHVRALGTTGDKRSAILPDVPTVAEAGVPGYEATIWLGIMAPTGTPKEIVDRLNAEIGKVVGQARDPRGLGQAGRGADDHDAGRVRRLPAARHRQVGARSSRSPAPRCSDGRLRILAGGAAQSLVEKRGRLRGSRGFTIDGTFSAVGAMRDKLLAGEPADIVILSRALVDELARERPCRGRASIDRCRPRRDGRRGAQRRSPARDRRQGRAGRSARGRRRDPFPRSGARDRRHPLRQGDARARRLGPRRRPAKLAPNGNTAMRRARRLDGAAIRSAARRKRRSAPRPASCWSARCRRAAISRRSTPPP